MKLLGIKREDFDVNKFSGIGGYVCVCACIHRQIDKRKLKRQGDITELQRRLGSNVPTWYETSVALPGPRP